MRKRDIALWDQKCKEILYQFKKKDYEYGIDIYNMVKEYIELRKKVKKCDLNDIAREFGRNSLWIQRVLILEECTETTWRLMKELKVSPQLVSYILYGIKNRCPDKQDEIVEFCVRENMDITKLHIFMQRNYLSYHSQKEWVEYKISYLDSFYNSLINAKDVLKKIDISKEDQAKLGIVKEECEKFIKQVNEIFLDQDLKKIDEFSRITDNLNKNKPDWKEIEESID